MHMIFWMVFGVELVGVAKAALVPEPFRPKENGKWHIEREVDIVEIVRKHREWVNIYS